MSRLLCAQSFKTVHVMHRPVYGDSNKWCDHDKFSCWKCARQCAFSKYYSFECVQPQLTSLQYRIAYAMYSSHCFSLSDMLRK